jgi:hypothetical protein
MATGLMHLCGTLSNLKKSTIMKKYLSILVAVILFTACKKDDHLHPHDDNELITRVELKFTDAATKTTLTYTFQDKDADPKTAPEKFDKIVLNKGVTYTMSVGVFDDTKSPAKDITEEINEESDSHLFVFKTNPASLLAVSILDKDKNGLPIGLSSSAKTSATAGTGKLNVLLKHQPVLNGAKVKTGQEAGGSTDIDLTFDIEVK